MPHPPESAKQDERYKAAEALAASLPVSRIDANTIRSLLALVDEIDEERYSYWELSMGEDL